MLRKIFSGLRKEDKQGRNPYSKCEEHLAIAKMLMVEKGKYYLAHRIRDVIRELHDEMDKMKGVDVKKI
jgi:hypothetical protein